MQALKNVTTVLIAIMMFIILSILNGLHWKKDRASIIGFSFMETVYVLSLICIWS